ncbi:MAG: quinone oxidoreductase [Gammaproteobacteria bacterium]|nr:MAG: quinone oxidoreductase [Gammaproteobacteria bacterium]
MPKAAVIHEKGGPEVFRYEDVEVGDPGAGEVRLKHIAIGVNYADTYHRGGVSHPWPVGEPPVIVGFEATAEVMEIGAGVEGFAVGDRVVYGLPPLGAYSQERIYPVSTLLAIPRGIDALALAGIFMKGLTAYYLLHKTYAVKPGDWVLVHAAAGGMGNVLVPWAKYLGAHVIGTVGSEAKAAVARELGCDHVIDYSSEDFAARCRALTGGTGVHVVYESIGKATLTKSLDSLRPLGMCAAYGHASGPPDPVDIIQDLGARGSLFVTRPAVMHYLATRGALEEAAAALFDALAAGIIRSTVNHTYPLSEAANAHRAIHERRTTGSSVLLPFA